MTEFQFSAARTFEIKFPATSGCPEGAHYRMTKTRDEFRDMLSRVETVCDAAKAEASLNDARDMLLDLIDEILGDPDASEKILIDAEYEFFATCEVCKAIANEIVGAMQLDNLIGMPQMNREQRRAAAKKQRRGLDK